jgi:hypothetical protein
MDEEKEEAALGRLFSWRSGDPPSSCFTAAASAPSDPFHAL